MEKLLIPIMAVLFLSFASCDTDDLTNIDVDVDLETSEMIIAPPLEKTSDAAGYTFSVSDMIDLSSTDVADYLKDIEEVGINNIELKVYDIIDGENTRFEAGTSIEIMGYENGYAHDYLEEGLDIVVGTTYNFSEAFSNDVESILQENEMFTVTIKGSLNNNATVYIKTTIGATFTVNPL